MGPPLQHLATDVPYAFMFSVGSRHSQAASLQQNSLKYSPWWVFTIKYCLYSSANTTIIPSDLKIKIMSLYLQIFLQPFVNITLLQWNLPLQARILKLDRSISYLLSYESSLGKSTGELWHLLQKYSMYLLCTSYISYDIQSSLAMYQNGKEETVSIQTRTLRSLLETKPADTKFMEYVLYINCWQGWSLRILLFFFNTFGENIECIWFQLLVGKVLWFITLIIEQ